MLQIQKNEYADRNLSFSSVYPGIHTRNTPILQNFTKRICHLLVSAYWAKKITA
jgi:hypothetical protein